MQIVINIDEDVYEARKKKVNNPKCMIDGVDIAIANGTPLPKGHWVKTPKAVMGEGYMWYCDKCEYQVYQDSSRDYPSEKYCPNCGNDNREVSVKIVNRGKCMLCGKKLTEGLFFCKECEAKAETEAEDG